MSAINLIGSFFDSDAKYLIHQCNCITWGAAHLAGEVFKRYPYADIYSERKPTNNSEPLRDIPGNIIVRGNGIDQRYIINLLGQFYPGKSRYPDGKKDGWLARKRYFFEGLKKVAQIENLESIAFPYCIGCGAAGGNWPEYEELINRFADHLGDKAKVYIYKLPELI